MARRGHGEGTIYQRKDGRWTAGLTLENGKRKYLYGKTRKEVQEKLRVALNEQKQGILVTGENQKLSAYLENWLETVQKPILRTSTYSLYCWAIRKHIGPVLGALPLQKLTAQRLQTAYAQWLEDGLSPRSIANIHAVLRKALENAVKWNLVSRNVAKLVSLPRVQRHEVSPLTVEQAQKLLETAKGHRLEALFLVAITTGMRRGELLALRWADIDLEAKMLYVRHTVNYITGRKYVENEPKTNSGRRRIVLPDVVIDALKVHRSQQDQERLAMGNQWQANDLVFCNRYGSYKEPKGLLRLFHSLLVKAGLPDMRFHDLRHSTTLLVLIRLALQAN